MPPVVRCNSLMSGEILFELGWYREDDKIGTEVTVPRFLRVSLVLSAAPFTFHCLPPGESEDAESTSPQQEAGGFWDGNEKTADFAVWE